MIKTATVFTVHRVRGGTGQVGRSVHRLQRPGTRSSRRPSTGPVTGRRRRSSPRRCGSSDVDAGVGEARSTAIDELDRVLGGGLVAGSVTLLGGEPGIGKSTLVLQLLAGWPGPTLYVSAEESPGAGQGPRASDSAARCPTGWIAAETSLARRSSRRSMQVGPELVVVDSIQTIADERVSSSPGSPTQVRTCAQQLVVEAKRRGVAIVLVGHVTKDGSLAGPRQLEHAVDTVLSFEGERHHALRLLRAAKHRFGPTSELGLFEMTDGGLVGVPDPSHLFLADRRRGVAGSVIVPAMAGQRPLLVEVQALTVPVPQGATGTAQRQRPRRRPAGDAARRHRAARRPRRSPATTCTSRPSAAPGSPNPAATSPWRWP